MAFLILPEYVTPVEHLSRALREFFCASNPYSPPPLLKHTEAPFFQPRRHYAFTRYEFYKYKLYTKFASWRAIRFIPSVYPYNMTRHLPLLVFFIYAISWIVPTQVQAQIDTLIYGAGRHTIEASGKGELRATIEAMPFVRDNEYKGDYVKGYTLPGAWLQPSISYQPLKNLQIEVGAYMLHFWGADKYPNFNYSDLAHWQGHNIQNGFHCVPVIRANMQLSNTVNVVVGSIYGKANHALAEPLYNDELNLSADPETGLQIIWDIPHFQLDTWINWESFIFDNDKGQESFSFGLSTRILPSRKQARSQWYLPIQMLFQHRGGEINTEASERSIKTWLNAAMGAGVQVPFAPKLSGTFNMEATATYFSQQAGTALPFSKGYGIYTKAAARLWRFRASLGYWYSHHFISILGNPLFGSISVNEAGITFPNSQMLTGHAEYAQELGKGFAWGASLDVFHHLATNMHSPSIGTLRVKNQTSLAVGIYVRACLSFLIKKF